jgi:SAM-dependent methyltransferase
MSFSAAFHARLRHTFIREGKSLWRAYMNAAVAELQLASPVLDLGSGAYGTASYHRLIPNWQNFEVESVDIAPDRRPTKIADIEQGIPYEDGRFQSVVNFNLLILLYDYRAVLRESYRVLAAGGKLYITVPFLVRISPDPADYFRFSPQALSRLLSECGFESVEIRSLGAGAVTAALAQIDFALPRLVRGLALRGAWGLDSLLTRRSGGKYRNADDYPLGHIVVGRKP